MKPRLMITVDVEAQPRRAEAEPLQRLIWGRFPKERAGIGEMMNVADKHGVKLTMFLDYCEEPLYGDGIREVGREIHARGHDLQLHAHPDFMTNEYWANADASRILNLNDTSKAQSDILFDFLVKEHQAATGENPIAYRGGGYRFNGNMLQSMYERGIKFNSSYNPTRKTQPLEFDYAKQFLWSNGCIEVPISAVDKFLNIQRPYEFNFNAGAFKDAERMNTFLEAFHVLYGNDAIAVLVMHSWSFLKFDKESGFFTGVDKGLVSRFNAFIKKAKRTHDIVTSKDVVALAENEKLSLDPTLSLDLFKLDKAANPEFVENKRLNPTLKENVVPINTLHLNGEEIGRIAEKTWQDGDYATACDYFEDAYLKGYYTNSGYRLGYAYYSGKGRKRNLKKALTYLSGEDQKQSRYALYYKGLVLAEETFEEFDPSEAKQCLEAAQALGVIVPKSAFKGLAAAMPQVAKSTGKIPSVSQNKDVATCAICGAAANVFTEMQGRKCPECGSVERQRVFATAYDNAISKHMDLSGKKGLIISMSVSERRFFKSRNIKDLTSVDVRAEAKADIVADICDMPQVKTASYDFVYASYVFPCVYDLDAALKEIKRVLKPNGCLISIDHLTEGAPIREAKGEDSITSWYGKGNYEKYKVGSFRTLGDYGMLNLLSKLFFVKSFIDIDVVTSKEMRVLVSRV